VPTPEEIATARQSALEALKESGRMTFRVCAESAEKLAAGVDSGKLPNDGSLLLRVLAEMFRAAGRARP
jgi:hypothetical protein